MITLSEFQNYETLQNKLASFLAEKCNEYNEARAFDTDDYYRDDEVGTNIDCWEIQGLKIVIWFHGKDRDTEFYTYELPLDILFDLDFKLKMKARIDEERERERLRMIEKRKRREAELANLREREKLEEINTLHKLMDRYPEEVSKCWS